MKRRCNSHDYSSRCIYMITLSKTPYAAPFSDIVNAANDRTIRPMVRLLPSGSLISRQLRQIPLEFPEARILQYAIMPDHLHFVIFITRPTDYRLGKLIGRFTGNCTRANNLNPIFEEGYNDRIVRKKGQLDTLIKYVRDNPRRLLIRRLHPELFSSRHTVFLNGSPFMTYGNILLLRHPVKEAVRISSKFTKEELEVRKAVWNEAIREQGVLVSPFISPAEKEIRDAAIADGASVILVTNSEFGERFKPSGSLFELCSQGRLLLISAREPGCTSQTITRADALRMNNLAESICAGLPEQLTARLYNTVRQ